MTKKQTLTLSQHILLQQKAQDWDPQGLEGQGFQALKGEARRQRSLISAAPAIISTILILKRKHQETARTAANPRQHFEAGPLIFHIYF